MDPLGSASTTCEAGATAEQVILSQALRAFALGWAPQSCHLQGSNTRRTSARRRTSMADRPNSNRTEAPATAALRWPALQCPSTIVTHAAADRIINSTRPHRPRPASTDSERWTRFSLRHTWSSQCSTGHNLPVERKELPHGILAELDGYAHALRFGSLAMLRVPASHVSIGCSLGSPSRRGTHDRSERQASRGDNPDGAVPQRSMHGYGGRWCRRSAADSRYSGLTMGGTHGSTGISMALPIGSSFFSKNAFVNSSQLHSTIVRP